MKALFTTVLSFVARILRLLEQLSPDLLAKILNQLFFSLNSLGKGNYYFTLIARPRMALSVIPQIPAVKGSQSMVLQGPVDDFTLGTIDQYLSIYPEMNLIVSTWDTTPAVVREELARRGVHVVTSSIPARSGFLNFNYQRLSTLAGIELAKELGMTHVIKTRTDQRFYNPNLMSFLNSIRLLFPVRGTINLSDRIWLTEVETLKQVPFALCDMFQYGAVDDILMFWSVPEYSETLSRSDFDASHAGRHTVAEWLKMSEPFPELYLGRSLANRLFGEAACEKDPVDVYEKLLRSGLGVLDKSMLDLFWPKYHAKEKFPDYVTPEGYQKLNFADWVTLYNPEQVAVLKINLDQKI
jgi:hypothetical protein